MLESESVIEDKITLSGKLEAKIKKNIKNLLLLNKCKQHSFEADSKSSRELRVIILDTTAPDDSEIRYAAF